MMRSFVLIILLVATVAMSDDLNFLSQGTLWLGSSFRAVESGLKTSRDHYFDKLADNDEKTFWAPMEMQAPHWLEWRWQAALRVDRFRWNGKGINHGVLYSWDNGEWKKLVEITGGKGEITFSITTSERFRLVIDKCQTDVKINEMAITGPSQPVPPAQLPIKFGNESIRIIKFDTSAKVSKPGDTLKLTWQLKADAKLTNDYYFLVKLREKPADKFRWWTGDMEVTTVIVKPKEPSSKWNPGQTYTMTAKLPLPLWTPYGKIPVDMYCIGGSPEVRAKLIQAPLTVSVVRSEPKPDFSHPVEFALGDENGQHGFMLNGEYMPPFMMRYWRATEFERFYESRLNGINVQNFIVYLHCVGVPEEYPLYFQRIDQQINAMLRVRPKSYFFLGIDLRPDRRFLQANPDVLMQDRNGEIIYEKPSSPGLVSFGSEKYLAESKSFINQLLNFLHKRPYANRIVGYQPWTYTKTDAFIGGLAANNMKENRDEFMAGDFHPGAIAKFREFLKDKYQSETKLREAWNMPKVTFENAMPPQGLLAEDAPGNVFRNPLKNRAVFDYWEFFPTLIGGFHQKIAAELKKLTNHKTLVFMHYGAILNTLCATQPGGNRHQGNNNDFYKLLTDPNIDMFVQSFSYFHRHSGEPSGILLPVDSVNLHKKIYLADYDARTFSTDQLTWGRHRGVKETEALIKRDFSFLMIKNAGAWLADMSYWKLELFPADRNSWFTRKEIAETTRNVLDIFQQEMKAQPKKSAAQIAVWIGTDSVKYEDTLNAAVIYRNLLRKTIDEGLNYLGAPYDIYLLDDLDNPEFRDNYKLHIFLNAFTLSPSQRQAVNKLKCNQKTLFWFYAPGYVDAANGLGTDIMSELTDIHIVEQENRRAVLETNLNNSFAGALKPRKIKAETYGGTQIQKLHPAAITPLFKVTDSKAHIWGVDDQGNPNFAVKKLKNHTSIYSAVPYMPYSVLRNIAKQAGVHLYTEQPVIMMADNRFLVFNNGYEAEKDLVVKLPHDETITDAVSGEVLCRNKNSFMLKMASPSTRILIRRQPTSQRPEIPEDIK